MREEKGFRGVCERTRAAVPGAEWAEEAVLGAAKWAEAKAELQFKEEDWPLIFVRLEACRQQGLKLSDYGLITSPHLNSA